MERSEIPAHRTDIQPCATTQMQAWFTNVLAVPCSVVVSSAMSQMRRGLHLGPGACSAQRTGGGRSWR